MSRIDVEPVAKAGILSSPYLMIAVAVVVCLLVLGRGMTRNFDLDEHQFVAPAALLGDKGLLPYKDYPYFHMPTLVYLYQALTGWTSHRLLAARLISCLCGTATLLLLFGTGWRALAALRPVLRWLLAGGVTFAFMTSQLFIYANGWAWNHDSAVLCALAAFLLEVRGLRRGNIWLIGLAGTLAGLALGIRLSFALAPVPMAIVLFLASSPLTWKQRLAALALAGMGATIVLIPAIVPWIEEPDQFIFGNLGYAALSTRFYAQTESGAMTWPGKLLYAIKKFLSDPGNALCFALGVYALGWSFWKMRAWRSVHGNELLLLLGLMPALLIGALGPTPSQQQYMYMMLPFLALAGIYVIALETAEPHKLERWRRIVFCAAILPALIGLPRWYWQAVFLPRTACWTPLLVHETGQWIAAQCPPHARVLTIDPIFPLEAGLEVYPEYTVGRFVMHVGKFLSSEDRRRYHMAWDEEFDRMLAERPPQAIFCHDRAPSKLLIDYARAHGFKKIEYRFCSFDGGLERREENFELWVQERSPQITKNKLQITNKFQ